MLTFSDKDPEAKRAYHREWRRRERFRQAEGLPPRRLHTVTKEQRDVNVAAADEFFASTRGTKEVLEQNLSEMYGPTPPSLIDRFNRDSARYRAVAYLLNAPDPSDRLRVSEARRFAYEAEKAARQAEMTVRQRARAIERVKQLVATAAAEAAENARLDAIGREVNRSLRYNPPRPDPAAPHSVGAASPHTGGLNR